MLFRRNKSTTGYILCMRQILIGERIEYKLDYDLDYFSFRREFFCNIASEY
jgi:hypothetical protein